MARNSGLTLVVGANIDAFQAKSQAITRALQELEKDGGDFRATFDKLFDTAAANPAAALQKMSSGLRGEIQTMMREARAAAELGQSFNPAGGMSSAGSLQAAANYENVAKALRDKMEAANAAALADERHALAARQLEAQLYPEIRALEQSALQLREQAGFLAATEQQMNKLAGTAQRTGAAVNRSNGEMRAGAMQLSFQVSDVATQFASGTSPMVIFAQQGGQVAQAMGMMAGEAGGLLGLLGGPWGIALTAGATVLATLGAQMGLFSSEVERNADKLKENADELGKLKAASDGVAEAQSALGEMFDLTTGKLKSQNDILRMNVELMSAKLRAEAASGEAALASARERAGERSWGGLFSSADALFFGQTDPRAIPMQSVLDRVRDGTMRPSSAMAWAKQQNFDGLNISKSEYLGAIARGAEVTLKTATADRIDKSLADGTLDRELRKAPPKRDGQARSASAEASTGDMVALLKDLLPGVSITATTNGKHKKGSDHYAGRAIDFVPAGGMGAMSTQEVYDLLIAAGVDIRRNASGREQFFGPGRSASKPGDHDDHFHLAWQGRASPEGARRAAETAARKAERDAEDVRQGYAMQDEELLKARTEQQVQSLRAEQEALEFRNELLDIEGQIAPTLKEKLRLALEVLANDRKIAQSKNDEALARHDIDQATHAANAAGIDQVFDGRARVIRQQNAGAMGQYRQRLESQVGDMNQALEGVKANGLASLEDGLVGIISGTESVSQAFKRMAASILADLARIAIQKAILSVFGFSSGNVPAYASGHVPGFAGGIIAGPGTGTSDSILAWHQGMGMIRVSNGESIITAEGTRKHRGLLKAINDNTLPSFASGMIGDVSRIRYPAAPSMASLGGSRGQPVFLFDMRGAITTAELMAQINGQMQRVGMAAMVGGSQMAQQELAERRMQVIPT